jgi:hypothetical protein
MSRAMHFDGVPQLMNDHDFAELLQREEQKRWRQWDAAERWRVIQQTITWAERQATVQRNTPSARLREQRRKLAQLSGDQH